MTSDAAARRVWFVLDRDSIVSAHLSADGATRACAAHKDRVKVEMGSRWEPFYDSLITVAWCDEHDVQD